MSKLSIETDLKFSLKDYFTRRLFYFPMRVFRSTSAPVTRTGTVNGQPLGSLYRDGDVFVERGASQTLGKLYYVSQPQPGNPTITLIEEQPHPVEIPAVKLVFDLNGIEQLDDVVYVGIKLRPSARRPIPNNLATAGRVVITLPNGSTVSVLTAEYFYKSRGTIHIEATNEEHVAYVFEQINKIFSLITSIYQLRLNVFPDAPRVENTELLGFFKSVIDFDFYAYLTADTPLHELPPGSTDGFVDPYEPLEGISVWVEKVNDADEPVYVEHVGDYPLNAPEE